MATSKNTINTFKKKKIMTSIKSCISTIIKKAIMLVFASNFEKASVSLNNLYANN